jgi:hypothetical protein
MPTRPMRTAPPGSAGPSCPSTPTNGCTATTHRTKLRTWVIRHLSPDSTDTDWNPEALAADTLAALTLEPGQASAIAASWRKLPIEQIRELPIGQIRELHRHKVLTLHLGHLIGYLPPGLARDQLTAWHEVREHLP